MVIVVNSSVKFNFVLEDKPISPEFFQELIEAMNESLDFNGDGNDLSSELNFEKFIELIECFGDELKPLGICVSLSQKNICSSCTT